MQVSFIFLSRAACFALEIADAVIQPGLTAKLRRRRDDACVCQFVCGLTAPYKETGRSTRPGFISILSGPTLRHPLHRRARVLNGMSGCGS